MDNTEQIQRGLLVSALNEINGLRRQNERMATRLDMFDKMCAMAGLNKNMGAMHPDVAYEIERHLEATTKTGRPSSPGE